MAVTPEHQSAYVTQQMNQFQGKQLTSMFLKEQARQYVYKGGVRIHPRVSNYCGCF